jgi:MFS family permease
MQEEADGAPGAILAAAIVASSMAFLDTTVVALALPTILADLGGGMAAGQWVVEAYLLFLTAPLLVGGALGDRFGRKRVFASGIAFFGAASLGCALAQTDAQLVLARAVQGIGAAAMVPGSLAMISASIRPEARGRALGLWSAATSIATAFGPPLGGWAIELWSWPLIFLVNLPLSALALLALRRAPESLAAHAGRASTGPARRWRRSAWARSPSRSWRPDGPASAVPRWWRLRAPSCCSGPFSPSRRGRARRCSRSTCSARAASRSCSSSPCCSMPD